MLQPNAPIMTAVSLAADATSSPIQIKQEWGISIQAVWTGTPVGNFTIETSCDVGQVSPSTGAVSGVTHWSTYTGSTQAAGGAGGDFTWRITSITDSWVRLKYTAGSSTGTVNARYNAKGV